MLSHREIECISKFTMWGNNVTMKYWLIADRPNKTKKMWPFFAPCPDFIIGGGGAWPPGPAPLFLHPWFRRLEATVRAPKTMVLSMLRRFGKIGPNIRPKIDQIWALLSRGHRWAPGVRNPLKSLLVNCYLEIKSPP